MSKEPSPSEEEPFEEEPPEASADDPGSEHEERHGSEVEPSPAWRPVTLSPEMREAIRRMQQVTLSPGLLEAIRRMQQVTVSPEVLEAIRRMQQVTVSPEVLEAIRRMQQVTVSPEVLASIRRMQEVTLSPRATSWLAFSVTRLAANQATTRAMAALVASEEFGAWRVAAAAAVEPSDTSEQAASYDEPDALLTAAQRLAESPELAEAAESVLVDDEALTSALLVALAAGSVQDDPWDGEGIEEPLSEDDVQVIRNFFAMVGITHATGVLLVVATVTGLPLVAVIAAFASVAQLAGYSLRDLFTRDS
jgi:hypothetical protein